MYISISDEHFSQMDISIFLINKVAMYIESRFNRKVYSIKDDIVTYQNIKLETFFIRDRIDNHGFQLIIIKILESFATFKSLKVNEITGSEIYNKMLEKQCL